MSSGWECPRCGEVYGPSVKKCENPDCKKTPRKAPELTPEDLHDQLYAPSINQFDDGAGRKKRHGGGGGGQSDGSSGVF